MYDDETSKWDKRDKKKRGLQYYDNEICRPTWGITGRQADRQTDQQQSKIMRNAHEARNIMGLGL